MKRTPLIVAACVVGFSPPTPSQAKLQCSAEALPSAGSYWSYRIIDGRKCWYPGKPMMSRSLLEWPTHTPAVESQTDQSKSASVHVPTEVDDGFEARWRDRFLDAMGKY
jgi:hypothetical protein